MWMSGSMVALDQGNPAFRSGKISLIFSIYHSNNQVCLPLSINVSQIWSGNDLWYICCSYLYLFISLPHLYFSHMYVPWIRHNFITHPLGMFVPSVLDGTMKAHLFQVSWSKPQTCSGFTCLHFPWLLKISPQSREFKGKAGSTPQTQGGL